MNKNTINKSVQKFLEENVTFLYAYSFFSPALTPYATIGVVNKDKKDLFLSYFFYPHSDGRGDAHYWSLKGGHEFLTTNHGLFFFIDFELDEEEVFTTRNGVRFCYPEETERIVEEHGNRVFLTKYVSNALKDYSKAKIKIIHEQSLLAAKKEKEEKEKYQQRKEEFKKFLSSKGNVVIGLAEALWDFDIFYSYSDDINCYRAGKEKEEKLKALLESKGFDPKVVFNKLHNLRQAK